METAQRHGRSLPPWRLGNEAGATMVEYGMVLAMVALLVAGGAALLGTSLSGAFGTAADAVAGLTPGDRTGDSPPPQLPVPEEEAEAVPTGDTAAASKPGGPNANSANGAENSSGNSAHNK